MYTEQRTSHSEGTLALVLHYTAPRKESGDELLFVLK